MNAKELAEKHLSEYPEDYKVIDPLIEPLCKLMTKYDYITLHSCSGHVKVETKMNDPYLKQIKQTVIWVPNGLYIVFVAIKPIREIKKVVDIINKKYGYKITVTKFPYTCGKLTRRWDLRYVLPKLTNDILYEVHRNIYLEFKAYFDKKREQ